MISADHYIIFTLWYQAILGEADNYIKVHEDGQELTDEEDDDSDALLGAGAFGKTFRYKHVVDHRMHAVKTVEIKQAVKHGVQVYVYIYI